MLSIIVREPMFQLIDCSSEETSQTSDGAEVVFKLPERYVLSDLQVRGRLAALRPMRPVKSKREKANKVWRWGRATTFVFP